MQLKYVATIVYPNNITNETDNFDIVYDNWQML